MFRRDQYSPNNPACVSPLTPGLLIVLLEKGQLPVGAAGCRGSCALLCEFKLSARTLEQSGSTLAAAYTHGDNAVTNFALASCHFVGQRSDQPRPGHPEGMTN
jgi:hypothetical protein